MTDKLREVSEVVSQILFATNAYGYFSEKGIVSLREELTQTLTERDEAVIADYQTNFEQKHIASAVELARADEREKREEIRKEVVEIAESYKETCHENNHQRGCVSCVETQRVNAVIDNIVNKIKNLTQPNHE